MNRSRPRTTETRSPSSLATNAAWDKKVGTIGTIGRLTGKVAVVTQAASGIGTARVGKLAAEVRALSSVTSTRSVSEPSLMPSSYQATRRHVSLPNL
jgi:hypothetical protein